MLAGVHSGGGSVIIWDWEKGKEINRLKGAAFVVFSPDGKTLAVTGFKEPARLYDTRTWKMRHLVDFNESTRWAAFSADSKRVAFSCFSGVVGICQVETGKIVEVFHPGFEHLRCLAFSPDGKILAAAGMNKVVLWDLKAKKVQARLEGHKSPMGLVYSPDGKTLVGVGYEPDRVAFLWDPVQGKKKGQVDLEAMRHGNDAAFSPDGKTLAFVGGGGSDVFLWDFAAGRRLGILSPKDPGAAGILLEKVAFSPDGKFLATGASNGTVPLWNLPKKEEWRKKDRLERIEKLVLQLDDARYHNVWPVVQEILTFGDEALPYVQKAQASDKLYQRHAAQLFFLRSAYKGKKHPSRELFSQTAPMGMDYFLDQFFLKKQKAKEKDWEQVVKLAQAAAAAAKDLGLREFRPPNYVKFPLVKGAEIEVNFIHQKRILAESVSTQNQAAQSLILSSGPVNINGQVYNSIIFANGDVKIGTTVEHSVVVCNGNIQFLNLKNSLIVARGKVNSTAFIGDSVIEQEEENPLGLFRFFNPVQVGIEVALVKSKLCVQKLEVGKFFAKAGFKTGDEILSINKTAVHAPAEFRNLLRSRIIRGEANFTVQRNGKILEIPVIFSD
jgi:WD40 repeat protein